MSSNVYVLWRRFFAAILDVVFLSMLGGIVNTTFGVTRVTGGMPPEQWRNGLFLYTTATTVDWWWITLLAFGYFFVQEALFSTTLGKAMLSLRVIPSSDDRDCWRITLWQAFIRNLLRPLEVTQLPYSFGVGFIAALCMFLTEKRQRVGDLLARTIVVDSRTVPYPAYRRSQVYVRVATVLTLLACFVAYCSVFLLL